jgi:hypothetical protein
MLSERFRVCVVAASKDLREGTLRRRRGGGFVECPDFELSDPRKDPNRRRKGCATLKTVHDLLFRAIIPHERCDSPLSIALQIDQATGAGPQGELLVRPLVTLFSENGLGRGIHAGDFVWRGPNYLRIVGRMSGTTNAGLFREPVFKRAERCSEVHVLYGRLCGRVEQLDAPRPVGQLHRAQLTGTYRIVIRAERDEGRDGLPGSDSVEGVFEGAFLVPCR